MDKEIERLQAEIDQLLKEAEQLDAEQDAALGSRRGDELPDELKRREDRLAKIGEAKTRLKPRPVPRQTRNNAAGTRLKPSGKPKGQTPGQGTRSRGPDSRGEGANRTSPTPSRRS